MNIIPFHNVYLLEERFFANIFSIHWQVGSGAGAFSRGPIHHTFQEQTDKFLLG
jgi:hypothetical protein